MISPTRKDIGRSVIYKDGLTGRAEEGVITSFNDGYVFVRYGINTTAQATARENLSWSD